jgi:tetratricopeptide (TPR) repeat protein
MLKAQAETDASASKALQRSLAILSEVATLAGDFTTGEEAARELMQLAPKTAIGPLSLAYVHLQAREYTDAEELYLDVLSVDPGNTTALNNLGNVYYMQRDLESAGQHFEAILNVEDVKPYAESLALSNLAELIQLQGGVKDAESLYKQAIEAQPKGAWGYMGLAALYDISGRYDDAVDAMISGWERDDNKVTRLNMHFYQPEWYWQRDALIAEIEGDLDTAIGLWSKVLHGEVEPLHKAAAWHLAALEDAEK